MLTILRVAALAWGDAVIEGAFFIMQTYLTQVWKLNFTTAAAFLNIWGGIYRILPLFFLFLADTLLGNFKMLAVSGITSTMGLVLITLAATPFLGNSISMASCQEKETSCVGHTEKAIFLIGMTLVALGRAARFASTEAFVKEQNDDLGSNPQQSWLWLVVSGIGIVFFVTPLVGIFAFPYIKKWYVLFGASAICTASATLFYLSGCRRYKKPGARTEGSPITDIFRVFVAAVFIKRSQPFPKHDEGNLYVVRDEQFQELSPSPILGFLHKAAIIVDDDTSAEGEVKKRSWKVCSVSEVESVKILIRVIPLWSCFIMCGVVSSIGNTYLIEQMSHMKSNIGSWKAPPQVVLLIFIIFKYFLSAVYSISKIIYRKHGALVGGVIAMGFSVICCAAAACVERRRLHLVRRHHLLDESDVETPMSAFWLLFPFVLLVIVDIFYEYALFMFHDRAPKLMERYHDCFVEGVIGFGYMCGALSVYVVGKISEMGGGKGWFQDSLNRSRLDRYYWVLTTLSALNLIVFAMVSPALPDTSDILSAHISEMKQKKEAGNVDGEADKEFRQEIALEMLGIKKSSALGLILRSFPKTKKFLESFVRRMMTL